MPRGKKIGPARGLFLAMQLMDGQDELLRNPPVVVVKPRELTPEEVRANKKKALAAAFEADYRTRKAREEAESKGSQENGERNFLLTHMGATREEKEILARCPLAEIPAALADIRRPPTDAAAAEAITKLCEVLVKR